MRPNLKGHYSRYQISYQAGYQPSGGLSGPALRLIPGLIPGLKADLVYTLLVWSHMGAYLGKGTYWQFFMS